MIACDQGARTTSAADVASRSLSVMFFASAKGRWCGQEFLVRRCLATYVGT